MEMYILFCKQLVEIKDVTANVIYMFVHHYFVATLW